MPPPARRVAAVGSQGRCWSPPGYPSSGGTHSDRKRRTSHYTPLHIRNRLSERTVGGRSCRSATRLQPQCARGAQAPSTTSSASRSGYNGRRAGVFFPDGIAIDFWGFLPVSYLCVPQDSPISPAAPASRALNFTPSSDAVGAQVQPFRAQHVRADYDGATAACVDCVRPQPSRELDISRGKGDAWNGGYYFGLCWPPMWPPAVPTAWAGYGTCAV